MEEEVVDSILMVLDVLPFAVHYMIVIYRSLAFGST